MYFILSKVLLVLIFPLTWIFILLLAAFFVKRVKLKKWLLASAIIVLYIFSNAYLLNLFAKAWNIPPGKGPAVYSCGILLGGFSSEDEKGDGYFNSSADRFIQGIKLLSTGRIKHLLVTSGNASLTPDKFSEGEWAKGQLEALHYPDSAILIEGKSRNTIENAEFSKVLLQHTTLKPPYLLITSSFHMRRALMIFKKQGYDVVPYPCDYIEGKVRPGLDDLIPQAGALSNWDIYLKELVGYAVDYFEARPK